MGYIYLLISMFLIASNFIVGNYGKPIPPWQLAFFRFFIALIFLLPFTLPPLKKSWPVLKARWLLICLYGILGVTIAGGFGYISLHQTSAINGAFIFTSSPILTLLIASAITDEKLSKMQWLSVFITLIGVLVIICKGNVALLLQLKFTVGDLWMLGVAISWAFYTVLIRRWRVEVEPLLFLACTMLTGLIGMLPMCIIELFQHQVVIINTRNIMTILYAGIFAGAIAYFTYIRGVMSVGSSKAGFFMYLVPVFATFQAYIFLQERLQSYMFYAIFLIALGIILNVLFPVKKITHNSCG